MGPRTRSNTSAPSFPPRLGTRPPESGRHERAEERHRAAHRGGHADRGRFARGPFDGQAPEQHVERHPLVRGGVLGVRAVGGELVGHHLDSARPRPGAGAVAAPGSHGASTAAVHRKPASELAWLLRCDRA